MGIHLKKEKNIEERLREEIKKKYKSVRSFSLKAGIFPQQMQNYFACNHIPGGVVLQKMANLGININYVLTGNTSTKGRYLSHYNEFPLLTKIGDISLGNFKLKADDYTYFNYPVKEKCFSMIVRGDSMLPLLEEGDIVLIDANITPEVNDLVAVYFVDGDQLIKRFASATKNEIKLTSENKSYDPLVINKRRINFLAPVIQLHHTFKRRR